MATAMTTFSPLIAPSLLAADFSALRDEIKDVEAAGADWLHLDVMDGNFVPNLSFGMPVIAALRGHSRLHFDVHMMVNFPDHHIDALAKAGADAVTVHVEASHSQDIKATLGAIAGKGMKAGLAINPETSVDTVLPYLNLIDRIVIMTVKPGFGGQGFIDRSNDFMELRSAAPDHNLIADGGITPQTAETAIKFGVNVLVAGTAIFGKLDRNRAIQSLRRAFQSE